MLSSIWKFWFPDQQTEVLSEVPAQAPTEQKANEMIIPKKSRFYDTVKIIIRKDFDIQELFDEGVSEIESLIMIFVDHIDEELETKLVILASKLTKLKNLMPYIENDTITDIIVKNHVSVLNKFLKGLNKPINLFLSNAPFDFLELDENVSINELTLPRPANKSHSLPFEIENIVDAERLALIDKHRTDIRFKAINEIDFSEHDNYFSNVHPKKIIQIVCKAKINKILAPSHGPLTSFSYLRYHITIRGNVDISQISDIFYYFIM